MKTGNNYTRRVVMAFTSCVDHTVSIQTLIAAFLARKAIFSLVYKFKIIAFLGNYCIRPDSPYEREGVAMQD